MVEFLAASPIPSGEVIAPWMLGPIAAFVFLVFVNEIIVPGKTYRRVLDENKRLSEAHDKALAIAQSMVESAKRNNAAIEDVVRALDIVAKMLAEARHPKAPNDPESRTT